MPDPADSSAAALSREDRKQLLILACQADRIAWCDSCRPRPRPPAALAANVLSFLEPLFSLVPGLPGRWLRRMGFFTRLARQFGILPS